MSKKIDRREFLKSASTAAIGGALSFHFLGRPLFAQFPHEERTDSVVLDESGKFNLSPMMKIGGSVNNEFPRLAMTENGKIYVVYVSVKNGSEGIYLREIQDNGKSSEELRISEKPGFEYRPVTVAAGNRLHVIWAARRDGESRILHRVFSEGNLSPEETVSASAMINWNPAAVAGKDGALWIAWESKKKEHFEVLCRRLEDGSLKDIQQVSTGTNDCRRPSLCVDTEGIVWAAWDRFGGNGNSDIFLKPLNGSGDIQLISNHPASDLAPSIASDKEGYIWIAWHSNRKGADGWDIPRWFQLRAFKNGKLFSPAAPPPDKDLEKHGEVQSLEFMKVICGEDGRVIITGRPSHNFCMQWYKGGEWSPLYRLPKDGWGGRGQYLDVMMDKEDRIWLTRRDLAWNVVQNLQGMKGEYEKPKVIPYLFPMNSPALTGVETKPDYPEWNGYKFFFGDIHAHSWMSDGTGDLDEFYIQHRDMLKDDFAVLTDHDTFVGNGLTPSEWLEQKDMASHFNDPGKFVTMYGQEWTTARWPAKFGHKNIYHIDPDVPLMDHMDVKYDDTPKLFQQAKKVGAICIPHHIGWTGVDWENHDPEIQPLVEICSNHGAFEFMGNKPIFHRGGKKGCFVRDGLGRGLKFGLVAGSDTHGLIWHHRVGWKRNCLRTGLTCILAKELTQEALFNAMKERRVFATSGIKMRIVFEVADTMMGREVVVSEPPVIRADVASPRDMKWIEIIRDGETIYSYGGEGYHSKFTYQDDEINPGEHYYYLRVTTEDGNMGWSSPVWVTCS